MQAGEYASVLYIFICTHRKPAKQRNISASVFLSTMMHKAPQNIPLPSRNPEIPALQPPKLTLFPVDCFIMLKTVELKCVIWHNPLTKIEHEFIMFSHFFGFPA